MWCMYVCMYVCLWIYYGMCYTYYLSIAYYYVRLNLTIFIFNINCICMYVCMHIIGYVNLTCIDSPLRWRSPSCLSHCRQWLTSIPEMTHRYIECMYVCMCTCMYVKIFIHVCMYLFIYMVCKCEYYFSRNICMYVWMYHFMNVCMYVCICVRVA